MGANGNDLTTLIDAELRQSAPAPVGELAEQLAHRARGRAAVVLFYGSAFRADALEGVLDFYVLLDRVGAWPGSRVAAAANRLLPPNVGYFEGEISGQTLRAKYAVMSMEQFRDGMSATTLDTTLWARFSQPCLCVWARTEGDRAAAVAAIREAVVTAARWAAHLGPPSAAPADFWRALYARTYLAELRVESAGRARNLVDRDTARYENILPMAWSLGGVDYESRHGGELAPRLSDAERRSAQSRWNWRTRLGKPLNLLRLSKAAFTFDGAMDYVAWKIERHSGVRIEVAPWQRRFPLLAAPGLYWRLRRRGVLR